MATATRHPSTSSATCKDPQGITIGTVRETVKLALDQSQQVQRRNIQYSTGFTLAPGKYRMKFVVRENQTGAMGAFEIGDENNDIIVPDLKKRLSNFESCSSPASAFPSQRQQKFSQPTCARRPGVRAQRCRMSSARTSTSISSMRSISKEKNAPAPAAAPGLERRDMARARPHQHRVPQRRHQGLRNAARHRGRSQRTAPRSRRLPVRRAALRSEPGTYICQVNVIDDAGGSFSFPRTAILIHRPAVTTTPTPTPAR